jgi:hypothetical protein
VIEDGRHAIGREACVRFIFFPWREPGEKAFREERGLIQRALDLDD